MPTVTEPTGVNQTYLNARAAWDERYGDLLARAENWRRAFFAMSAVAALMGGALLVELRRSYVVPFVVAVDRLQNVVGSGLATETSLTNPVLMKARLQEYIDDTRTVSTDPLVTKRDLEKAFDMTFPGSPGDAYLKEFLTANSPFEKQGTTQVDLHNTIALTPTSYELTWSETNRDKTGVVTGKEEWKAILGVAISPPKSELAARKNPFGIYINSIAWSRSF